MEWKNELKNSIFFVPNRHGKKVKLEQEMLAAVWHGKNAFSEFHNYDNVFVRSYAKENSFTTFANGKNRNKVEYFA